MAGANRFGARWMLIPFGFFVFAILLFGAQPVSAGSATSTSTALSCAPSTVDAGASTDCTATVTGDSPTGLVSFAQDGGTGSVIAGDCTLSAGGSCTAPITATGTGSATIQATYAGDLNNLGSTSNNQAITVVPATPSLSATCPTVVVGAPASCTVTLGSNAYDPDGTATFALASSPTLVSPSTFDCTFSASSDSCSTPSVSTTGAGPVTFSVTYGNDPNNSPTPNPATATLEIQKAQSLLTANCASSTVVIGQQTTCTAVLSNAYSPSGTITWSFSGTGAFSPNPCLVPPGSCEVSFSPATSGTISATYSGDGNNIGSTGTVPIAADIGETITVTVANSGPPTTVTLSGCSVSPGSITANGVPQNFEATSGCSGLALTLPPATADSKYLTATDESSLPVPTCSSSPCQPFSATIYYQFYNTYQVSPKSPSTWAASGFIPVTGTSLGTGGADICTIPITTGTSSFFCQGWSDYDTQVVLGALQISPTEREAASPPAFTDTTAGGAQYDSGYYLQVLEDFQYSLVGATTAPTSPAISFTALGAPASSPLTGSEASLSIWMDSGTSWSAPQTISGSNATQRWYSQVTSGAATGGASVALTYYHQYFVTFVYSVIGGGNVYIPPSEQFQAFGNSTTGSQGWIDADSAYSFTNPLTGSTAGARWFSQVAAGTVSSAGQINATYYHQYALTLSFTVSGGGSYDAPILNSTSFGEPAATELSGTATVAWVDAGANWSVTSPLPSSTNAERWVTEQSDSGTATSPLVTQFRYYHQYAGSFSYSIAGTGGTPPVPELNYTALGDTVVVPLSTKHTVIWADSGSLWSAQVTLSGEQGERWLSNATGLTPVAAAFSEDVQYTHQFYVEVGVNTAAGGQVANIDAWHDQGDSVILNATSARSWTFGYWQGGTTYSYNGTARHPTLAVSGPANETAVFFPGLVITTNNEGAVGYAYGMVSGTVAPGTNATIYPPLGRNVTLTAMPKTVEIMFAGWTGVLTDSHLQSSVAIITPGVVHATFSTDYTDIRTFTVATLAVFIAACYVLIIRRGFTPKIPKVVPT